MSILNFDEEFNDDFDEDLGPEDEYEPIAAKTPQSKISGKIFALAKIKDCRPMTKKDEKLACCEIYPRAYSWILEIVKIIKPIEAKGNLNIWNITPFLLRQDVRLRLKFRVRRYRSRNRHHLTTLYLISLRPSQ